LGRAGRDGQAMRVVQMLDLTVWFPCGAYDAIIPYSIEVNQNKRSLASQPREFYTLATIAQRPKLVDMPCLPCCCRLSFIGACNSGFG